MESTRTAAAIAAAAFLFSPAAFALINPDFTPVDITQQSELIAKLQFGPVQDNACQCTVGEVLKGKLEAKTVSLDLGKAINDTQARTMAGCIASAGKEPAALFVGRREGVPNGYLHVAGKWIDLRPGKAADWELTKINEQLDGTWSGGTDMLLRAVEYILSDECADVPCNEGVSWGGIARIGNVPGEVAFAGPVDLDGGGRPHLFVASAKGDRLFQYRDGAFKGAAADRKLQSASLASAWIDCNADGRVDLVSWDGHSFSLHLQGSDGAFARSPAAPAEAPADGCLGLSVLDADGGGRPGLLVSTRGVPILLAPGGPAMKASRLPEADPAAAALGKAAACLVADFDGDGLPDIVQPFEADGLFFKGRGQGRFAAPARCGVATGKGAAAACTGDFDADGMLDILTAGQDGCEVWQNAGGGRFVPRRRLSGEIGYIAKPQTLACQACDINNDGRQDVLLAYQNSGAQIFFNRGFRCTGHCHKLDPTDNGLLPDAGKGQQAACVADFNGDGGQDMVLVLRNGDVYVFWRDTREASPLAVKIDLSPKAACPGPVVATGWLGKRCLGAWNVAPATATGFVGLIEAATCTVRWRLPAGQSAEREIEVEDGPVRLLIE